MRIHLGSTYNELSCTAVSLVYTLCISTSIPSCSCRALCVDWDVENGRHFGCGLGSVSALSSSKRYVALSSQVRMLLVPSGDSTRHRNRLRDIAIPSIGQVCPFSFYAPITKAFAYSAYHLVQVTRPDLRPQQHLPSWPSRRQPYRQTAAEPSSLLYQRLPQDFEVPH